MCWCPQALRLFPRLLLPCVRPCVLQGPGCGKANLSRWTTGDSQLEALHSASVDVSFVLTCTKSLMSSLDWTYLWLSQSEQPQISSLAQGFRYVTPRPTVYVCSGDGGQALIHLHKYLWTEPSHPP